MCVLNLFTNLSFCFNSLINLFKFLAALGLHCAGFLQLRRAGATLHCGVWASHCGVWASHCGGFSCCRARALGAWASVVAARRLSSCGSRALNRRLSSCGAQAQLLHGVWDLPGPGFEPVSPALAGGFLTTVSPGKSLPICLNMNAGKGITNPNARTTHSCLTCSSSPTNHR